MTRNVTDIVVGKPGAPETARLNGQQEYAAFGQILHQRETLLAGNSDGMTSAVNPGLPRYRFNAKEQDESGLQDFGARFYDNRLALWLRPDPVLRDYLDGKLNGGVYATKNLASYGFGWGNPVGYVDHDGNVVQLPAAAIAVGAGVIVGGAFEAGRQFYTDGSITDFGRIGTASVRGGISSGLAVATGGASLFATTAIGAGSNVVLGAAEREIHGDEQSLGLVAFDAASGGLSAFAGGYLTRQKPASDMAVTWIDDITEKSSKYNNYKLSGSAYDAMDNLRDAGYSITNKNGAAVFSNGSKNYTFNQAKSGNPSMYFSDGSIKIKYRFDFWGN